MEEKEQRFRRRFLADENKLVKLEIILRCREMTVFEYFPKTDTLILYDEHLLMDRVYPGYAEYLETSRMIHPDDRRKLMDFFRGRLQGPLEVRTRNRTGDALRRVLDASLVSEDGEDILVGYTRDITEQRAREENLEEQARRDSLTHLYNHSWGRELVREYLESKNPYDACGMLVIDIDYFKNINDTYGHLFGDRVLAELSRLLREVFDSQDVLSRTGGDEFVVFLKNIENKALVKKATQLMDRIRNCRFPENGYVLSCSVGISFLPENVTGFTYDQMFENADWALYYAKLNGRDRFEFCDNLYRYKTLEKNNWEEAGDIDIRYLKNDIVSTAFEIFEKMNSFDAALELLMRVTGIRQRLDRITVIQTDIKNQNVKRGYQWKAVGVPEALTETRSFTREDFRTLFHSYDEYGTTVLHYDDMGQYSPQGRELLIQGDAKTVLNAAMYCEGQYVGSISYVTCANKRHWTKKSRSEIGELTKLISAHLSKNMMINAFHRGIVSVPDYDCLTGLLSFTRFREEVGRIIAGKDAQLYVMVYGDFDNFRYFNQKYGYQAGDRFLKEFSNYVIDRMKLGPKTYFSRVVADQFVLFLPDDDPQEAARRVLALSREFVQKQSSHFPECLLRLRAGIYPVTEDCAGASSAIDAASYARKQIGEGRECAVMIYDDKLQAKQRFENEIINGMDEAITAQQFRIYLQPKVSLKDHSILGAEAQVRWLKKDGTLLSPDAFIPLYERNGRVTDLDLYIFEEIVRFLKKNNELGRRQLPISINASVLLASRPETAERYLELLQGYGVDPALIEVELLETETVSNYESVKKLFQFFREAGMKTSLDDFGAGYSMINMLADIPVDTVKLDHSLLEWCDGNPRGFYLLKQIVALIQGLGYEVLCEGVETRAQEELLKRTGCTQAQGFLYYMPMPLEEYERLLYGEQL